MRKVLFVLAVGIWVIGAATKGAEAVSLVIDGTEAIINGSFETGSFSPGWELTDGGHGFDGTGAGSQTVVYGAGYDGNYAARLGLLPGSAGTEPTGGDYMYQMVTLPSSFTNVNFTFAYRIVTEDIAPNDYFQVYMITPSASGAGVYSLLQQYDIGTGVQGVTRDLGWQTAQFNLSSQLAGKDWVSIGFRNYQNGNGYKTATDVDYYPEPCSLLLLGAGIAGLAGYKRWRKK